MGFILHRNFLSDSNIEIVSKESRDIYNNKESKFITNYNGWDRRLLGDSKVILVYQLTKDNSKSYNIIVDKCLEKFNKIPEGISFYYQTPGSYIPWHGDTASSKALTLYLNQEWDDNWGGYYMAKTPTGIEAIKPEYNLALEQTEIDHCTTTVHNFAHIRSTVQLFWYKDGYLDNK